jgi:membrane protease YdiL (CAAX protease family)
MKKFLYFEPILSVLTVIAFVGFYFFLLNSKALLNRFNKAGFSFTQTNRVFFQRILAFVVFGIVPALIIIFIFKSSLNQFGLIFQTGFSSFLLILLLGGLLILISRVHAKSNANLEIYPQIRTKEWNYSLLVLSAFSWMMYLFAYEFMFRGFLLFTCINELSIVAAILINVTLYALAHLSKGKREFFGAMPMGIILCAISIYYKSFLPAFWIHFCLAISNEWYSIKYNPEIIIIKKWL